MYDPTMDNQHHPHLHHHPHPYPYPNQNPFDPESDIGDARPGPPRATPYDGPPPIEPKLPLRTSQSSASPPPHQPAYDPGSTSKQRPTKDFAMGRKPQRKMSKKWQKRLYWIVPLCIVALVVAVLFEMYKDQIEERMQPMSDWLKERKWSWVIPVAILVLLSFPPLFGHEIVQLILGLAYPLGEALGIACAGAIIGEAACFVVFKYYFTGWVEKKIAQKVNWAATARVTQEAGFRGVLVIRYSIIPPHLANPLFSCTGMKFWIYMVTVILSLPKSIIFVALGSPASKNSDAAKWGKLAAVAVVVIITIFASLWIRKKMSVATRIIMAERGIAADGSYEELGILNESATRTDRSGSETDTSYKGPGPEPYMPYQGAAGVTATPYPPRSGGAR